MNEDTFSREWNFDLVPAEVIPQRLPDRRNGGFDQTIIMKVKLDLVVQHIVLIVTDSNFRRRIHRDVIRFRQHLSNNFRNTIRGNIVARVDIDPHSVWYRRRGVVLKFLFGDRSVWNDDVIVVYGT